MNKNELSVFVGTGNSFLCVSYQKHFMYTYFFSCCFSPKNKVKVRLGSRAEVGSA